VEWIDRAIEVVTPHAGQITLRGDTDFTLTSQLDRWHDAGHQFVFGMDAHPTVVGLAQELPEEAWTVLERLPRYEIATGPRSKPDKVLVSCPINKGVFVAIKMARRQDAANEHIRCDT